MLYKQQFFCKFGKDLTNKQILEYMSQTATIEYNGEKYELPVLEGSEGDDAIDIKP